MIMEFFPRPIALYESLSEALEIGHFSCVYLSYSQIHQHLLKTCAGWHIKSLMDKTEMGRLYL